jgi:hypothetical protein
MPATCIGVLALQGAFTAHASSFREVGLKVREIRRVADLEGLGGLMIPGGESTTLLNLMQDEPWFEGLRRFHDEGGVLAGTCAGAILGSRASVFSMPSSNGTPTVARSTRSRPRSTRRPWAGRWTASSSEPPASGRCGPRSTFSAGSGTSRFWFGRDG